MTQAYTYQTLKSAPNALFFLFSLLFSGGYAQVFPVQGSLQIAPPYSPFLTDYTAPGSQKLTLLLRSNDATLGDHPIRLRLVIEGVGITLRTKSGYTPPSPLTLMGGGSPTILYGEDLLDYFNPNNLDFAGFSQRDFQTSAKLPEGVYRFSFEVFDYHRQLPLSNKIMIVAWIVLNDPPLLNLPRNNTTVSLTDPTNIVFSWTPRHTASPNAAFSTDYVFKLVEIWPANRNPYDAFLSQPPLYETTLTENQLLYGPAEPALIAGRKYAWQVQARDENGRDIFKNQGKSEVFLFQFGDALSAPENLHKEGDHAQTLTLLWEPPVKGQTPSQYNLRYKTVSGDKWQEINTDKEWVTLINLQPNTDYEAQARSHREDIYSDYTPLLRLKTAEKAAEFTCGQPPPLPKLDKTTRLLRLNLGDIFTCNDWRIVVTEITRSAAGEYTGKGMMAVKLFNGASINVTFHGAINADYQLITGGVESIYNKDSKMALVVEEMKRIGEKKKAQPEEVATDTTLVSLVVFPGKIDSVYFDKDKKEVVVVDTEGKKTSYPQKINPATQEPKIMQITDAAGNTVIVGKDGTVAKGVATGGGSDGNTLAGKKLDKLERMILVSLNKFKKEIEDYQLGQKQAPPKSKGNGPNRAEWEMEMFMGDFPKCLKKHKDKLNEIKNNITLLLDSTGTSFKSFAMKVKEKMKSDDKTTQEKVDKAVCEALSDGLFTETITIKLLRSDGTLIKNGFSDLITADPAMPTLSVKANSDSANSTTEVFFRLKIEYNRDNRLDKDFFPADKAKKIKVNENWKIDFGDTTIRGGKATLYCNYGDKKAPKKDSLIFYIRGTNPTEQAIKDYIYSKNYNNIWFFTRLIRQESKYQHFNSGKNSGKEYGPESNQGCPKWGPPHGWGLMQLDLLERGVRPTAQELWSWKANIDKGYKFLNGEKKGMVNNHFNEMLLIVQGWNDENRENLVDAHNAQTEGLITYSHANSAYFNFKLVENENAAGTNRSFIDATWIKNYNGSSPPARSGARNGFYYNIRRDDNLSKPSWVIYNLNNNNHNYVEAVSNQAE